MKELFTRCYMCDTLIELGKVKDKRKKPNELTRYEKRYIERDRSLGFTHKPYYLCSVKCREELKELLKD